MNLEDTGLSTRSDVKLNKTHGKVKYVTSHIPLLKQRICLKQICSTRPFWRLY